MYKRQVLSHVVVRVTADAVLELHIDMEEANGVGLRNGDTVRGIKQACLLYTSYSLNLDCTVTQDGFPPRSLREMLIRRFRLSARKRCV